MGFFDRFTRNKNNPENQEQKLDNTAETEHSKTETNKAENNETPAEIADVEDNRSTEEQAEEVAEHMLSEDEALSELLDVEFQEEFDKIRAMHGENAKQFIENVKADMLQKLRGKKSKSKLVNFVKGQLGKFGMGALAGAGVRSLIKNTARLYLGWASAGSSIAVGSVLGGATAAVQTYRKERLKVDTSDLYDQLDLAMEEEDNVRLAHIIDEGRREIKRGHLFPVEVNELKVKLQRAELRLRLNLSKEKLEELNEVDKFFVVMNESRQSRKELRKLEGVKHEQLEEKIVFEMQKNPNFAKQMVTNVLVGSAAGGLGGAVGHGIHSLIDSEYVQGLLHKFTGVVPESHGVPSTTAPDVSNATTEGAADKMTEAAKILKLETLNAKTADAVEKAQQELLAEKFTITASKGEGATNAARELLHDYLINKEHINGSAHTEFSQEQLAKLIYAEDSLVKEHFLDQTTGPEHIIQPGQQFELTGSEIEKAWEKAQNLSPEELKNLASLLKKPDNHISDKALELINSDKVVGESNKFYDVIKEQIKEKVAESLKTAPVDTVAIDAHGEFIAEEAVDESSKTSGSIKAAKVAMIVTTGLVTAGIFYAGVKLYKRYKEGDHEDEYELEDEQGPTNAEEENKDHEPQLATEEDNGNPAELPSEEEPVVEAAVAAGAAGAVIGADLSNGEEFEPEEPPVEVQPQPNIETADHEEVTITLPRRSGLTVEITEDSPEVAKNFFKDNEVEIHGSEFNGKKLTVEDLERAGLEPVHELKIGDVNIKISEPYRLGRTRLAVTAYVQDGGSYVARSYYLSNSQGVWRYIPGYKLSSDGRIDWYDKAMSEEAITVPSEIQQALGHISLDSANIKTVQNPNLLFAGTGRDLIKIAQGEKDRTVILEVNKGPKDIPGLESHKDRSKSAPESVDITDPVLKPNFNNKVASWIQKSNIYVQPGQSEGMIEIDVFESENGELRYMFCNDQLGRAWLAGIETTGPIGSTGLRREWVKGTDITTPAYEYFDQSEGYGNNDLINGDYVDMYKNYISKIPLIKEYLSVKSGKKAEKPTVKEVVKPEEPKPRKPRAKKVEKTPVVDASEPVTEVKPVVEENNNKSAELVPTKEEIEEEAKARGLSAGQTRVWFDFMAEDRGYLNSVIGEGKPLSQDDVAAIRKVLRSVPSYNFTPEGGYKDPEKAMKIEAEKLAEIYEKILIPAYIKTKKGTSDASRLEKIFKHLIKFSTNKRGNMMTQAENIALKRLGKTRKEVGL